MRWISQDNYEQHRNQIQSGDLLAWSGRSAVGRLVRVTTASSWSHVAIALRMENRGWVIEAREFVGVQIVPLSSYLNCAWIPIDSTWGEKQHDFAISKIGKSGYSYVKAVKAWYQAAAMRNVGLDVSAKSHICSSLSTLLLANAGVDVPNRLLTPGELVDHCLTLSCGRG